MNYECGNAKPVDCIFRGILCCILGGVTTTRNRNVRTYVVKQRKMCCKITSKSLWLMETRYKRFLEAQLHSAHPSKWAGDLKINGTQENITFSGPVFHGLSCGVFLFVASVSFKNHLLNGLNFSTANQVLLFYGF